MGIEKNEREAVRWYRVAAVQGYQVAQLNLGICYARGRNVEKDVLVAACFYQMASESRFQVATTWFDGLCLNEVLRSARVNR